MPAFTAIGVAVASALSLTGTAAVIAGVGLSWAGVAVASVVAIGASYVTSRIIGGSRSSGAGSAGDPAAGQQGGRIQLPPATNNKIPVVYGRAFTNGMITDARLISTDQKTNNVMYYCLVLSETCNDTSATYAVNNIYWNDLRLIQESGAGNQHKILKGVKKVDGPGEDFEDTNFKKDSNNRVQIRVYAGNSTAAQQIYPAQATGNTQNAYDFWPNGEWDSTYKMEGLIFAMIRLEYDAETGFTNLPTVTFDLENSLKNPALVWKDYMTSDRYGANIAVGSLNNTELVKWQNYCDELIRYEDKDTASTTQKRYEINGPIDTNRPIKDNIDAILRNGGAWMSYDVSDAKWRPIIKKAVSAGDPADPATHFTATVSGTTMTVSVFPEGRIEAGQTLTGPSVPAGTTIVSQITPLTAGESTGQKGRYTLSQGATGGGVYYTTPAGLLTFNDDNIISGINLSSTRLDDLYNAYEVEFFDKYNKDQRAYARDQLPSGQRNPQEPDNTLSFQLELCNNSVQADLLGNMELRQSRDDLVVEFTAAHYGIQAQAGDVIQIYNDIYGWSPKYFRVMRIKETETQDGALLANISALEYNGDVYTVESIAEFTTEANIGITPVVSSANLVTPADDGVVVTDVNASAAVPNIVMAVEIPDTGGPYDEIQVWYATGPLVPGYPGNNEYRWVQSAKPVGNESLFKKTRAITGISITNSDTVNTGSAHGLLAGDSILFKSATANGLTQYKQYFVLDTGLTATAFKLGLTANGSVIALTNGTGLNLAFKFAYPVIISTLPGNAAGQQYYFRVRVGLRGAYSGFTNPDTAVLTVTASYVPDPGAGSQEVLNIKQAILKLDFGKCVLPNNGFWVWKTMTQIDFGSLSTASPYQLDLGLTAVTENTVTAATDIEDFVWQIDPE